MQTYLSNRSVVKALVLASSLSLALTSCQDEEFGYDISDIRNAKYAKDFVATFGDVDPNHTWNTATRASITVDINFDDIYTVKVYTANPRYPENNAYLVGQFDNVESGSHTFLCDMPATVECAYVGLIDCDGNRMILPAEIIMNRASVEFGTKQTRTVYNGDTPFIYGSSSNYVITTIDDIRTPLATLPEQTNNTGKVSQNFEYISMGAFELAPIYSITSNQGGRYSYDLTQEEKNNVFGERLGVYTYDSQGNVVRENGSIKITWVWHMNRGVLNNDLTALTAGTWYQAHKQNENADAWHDMYWFQNNIRYSSDQERDARENYCVWNGSTFKSGYDKIRTQGISLNLPSGTRFGFVLDTDHGNVFSNSSYNLDEGSPSGNALDHIKDTYAATFHANNTLYLAFEDWGYSSEWHDNDFNDLVLKLIPSGNNHTPLIIDKDVETDPIIYIVACEDLGGTFDWDFNDVVFGIEHVSGQKEARIKLLAAGGTLPIALKYKGMKNGVPTDRDVQFLDLTKNDNSAKTRYLHAAFGTESDIPVNVGAKNGVNHDPVYSYPFEVENPYAFSVLDGASQFVVHVEYLDKSSQNTIHVPNYEEKKKVPQAFLIADPKWQWPSENQFIVDKYPEFSNWVTNFSAQNNTNWTHTIWGNVREFNAIPSGAANMLDFGAVQYNGNVATITLSKDDDKMTTNSDYKLAIMLAEEATAEFWYTPANGTFTKIDANIAPNGVVQAEKLTTFTISSDMVNLIKGSGNNGEVKITFSSAAQGKVLLANWYKVGTKLPSNIEVQTPLVLNLNDEAALVYTTENQESPVTFSSENDAIVSVDQNGVVTGRAVTNTTGVKITLHQASSEHYAAADAYVYVKVINNQVPVATVDLDDSMFHTWSGAANNAVITNMSPEIAFSLNTSTDMIYGWSNVNYLAYADLTSANVLVITASAGVPRLLFNRTENEGSISVEIPRDSKYEQVVDNVDGSKSYIIDLAKIKEKDGFVHLHAIKGYNGNATITSMKLDQYSNINEYYQDPGNLTGFNYNKYTSGTYYSSNPTVETENVSCTVALNATNTGDNSNVIYGDNTPSAYTYKIMDSYKALKVTVKSGNEPRFFFNRKYAIKDNNENGETLDIAGYKTTVTENGKTIYYINLAAIKRDKGFAHLNGIKTAWNGGIEIESIKLLY